MKLFKRASLFLILVTMLLGSAMADKELVQFIDKGVMKSSWYGNEFHGRKTASGEKFDQKAFTAAHKTLPFGTLLKITNTKNDRFILVRINDRGPYIKGRQLDVSKAAALELGFVKNGTAKLQVQEIKIKGVSDE